MDANIQRQLTERKFPLCSSALSDLTLLSCSPNLRRFTVTFITCCFFPLQLYQEISSFRQNKHFIQSDISACKPIFHLVEEQVVVPSIRWGQFSLLDWQLMWLLVKLMCDLKPCFAVLRGFSTSATPLGSICFFSPFSIGDFWCFLCWAS